MGELVKVVPVWAWALLALIVALSAGLGYQTLELAGTRKDYADYKADIAEAARKAEGEARQTEQKRQRDIDQVRTDAANQKTVDDALAARQRADNDSLRDQTSKLLADRAALSARLTARGKTIGDLADLLAQLRTEADGYAGELASALTASRRAGFACQRSYDAIAKQL
jgi:chromosome segregation ATPase